MAKNTLEEKIKNVGFWTIIFFVLYLIIGFLLESEWLSNILKLSDIYDLVKDGLSITAALLAPVAAFVLFSDWREQHEDIAIEADSSEVFNMLSELKDKLLEVHSAIDEDEYKVEYINEIFNEITNKVKTVKLLNSQIRSRKNGKIFSECADKLIEAIVYTSMELSQLGVYKIKILNPEEHNDYVETSSEEYAEYIQVNHFNALQHQITRSYPNLNILKGNLSILCNELKVKA